MKTYLISLLIIKSTLGWLSAGVAVVAGGVWKIYVYLDTRRSNRRNDSNLQKLFEKKPVNAVGGLTTGGGPINAGGHVISAGGDVNIGLTAEDLESVLRRRATEIEANAQKDAAVKDVELQAVREKLANLQGELDARIELHNRTIETLNLISTGREFSEERKGLDHNDSAAAEVALRAQVDAGGEGAMEASLRIGEFAESRVDFEAALAAYTHATALEPNSYKARENAGRMAMRIGRYDDAERQLRALVAIAQRPQSNGLKMARIFGLTRALELLGECLSFTKQYEAARAAYSEALSLIETEEERSNPLRPASPRVETLRGEIARLDAENHHSLDQLGGDDDDLLPLRQRLAGLDSDKERNTLQWADSANQLAEALSAQGHDDEAKPLYERALKIADENQESSDERGAILRINYAALLAREGAFDEAERLHTAAFDYFGPDHPIPVNVLFNYGCRCEEAGEVDRALLAFQAAIDRAQSQHGVGDTTLINLWIKLGVTAEQAEKRDVAMGAYDQAIAFLETEQSDDKSVAKLLPDLRHRRSIL